MDDKFLHDARRGPPEEFTAGLRAKLQAQGEPRPEWRRPWPALKLAPALAAAAALIAVVAVFTLPSVRASAQAFLNLFRVRNFAAVEFDESRLDRLRELNSAKDRDPALLVFDRTEVLKDTGPPRFYRTPEAAASAAGMASLRVPGYLPAGMKLDSIMVEGAAAARLTVNASKLRDILATLGIGDVTVPPNLEGAQVTVEKPPVVFMRFRSERRRVDLVQATSPQVTLPPGLDLRELGEVGLRILGLSASEAKRFASSIDWHSTLLVPVPVNATSFREVSVRGSKGLLVSTTGERVSPNGQRISGSVLLWSEGDMVYALMGNMDNVNLLEIASSMR